MAEKTERDLKRYLPFVIGGIIVLAAVIAAAYFFLQYQNSQKQLAINPATGVPQVEDLVERVGKLMELPSSETPTVAAVSDVTKLQGQQFFANAKNGDQVLIYSQAKKAILYRPSVNKIIEVGPVNLTPSEAPTQTATGSATQGSKPRVLLLNGTTVVGLTRRAETSITDSNVNVEVVGRENAASNEHEKTIVVDVSGKFASQARTIGTLVKGTVGSLPQGEEKPDADIVVILGSDFASQ